VYVAKPFSPREVVARIKAILKRTHSNHSDQRQENPAEQNNGVRSNNNADHSEQSDFKHDANGHQIHYLGNALALTKAEYSLLAAFLQSPKQVFSRRQLIEQVWSSQHPSDDRAIDTHIKTLRAKLRTYNPHTNLIITHRGFGYSLTK